MVTSTIKHKSKGTMGTGEIINVIEIDNHLIIRRWEVQYGTIYFLFAIYINCMNIDVRMNILTS